MWYNLVVNRNVTFAPGEFYHIYNRGVEKRNVFLDRADYRRFQVLLYLANSVKAVHIADRSRYNTSLNWFEKERGDSLVDIVAYCIMPNHFHILVREKDDGGVSKFVQKLSTGYTMYFNKRYERTGALFQGKFKATHANDDNYLKYLFSYIHLNPVKLIQSDWKERGIKNFSKAESYLSSYVYSSLLDHRATKRTEKCIVNLEAAPSYFADIKSMNNELKEWLKFTT